MVYPNRKQAARVLFEVLKAENTEYDTIAVMMNGAMLLGSEISRLSGHPMKLIFVKKIGLPGNNEYAIASVTERAIVPNSAVRDNASLRHYIEITKGERIRDIENAKSEIESALSKKLQDNILDELLSNDYRGKKVLLVDDGMATGTSMLCAVEHIRDSGAAMITVAVPVSSKEAYESLELHGVKVVCPIVPESFYAVGQFYDDFPQILISDAIAILKHHYRRRISRNSYA